jgi:hypothetical protein
MTEKLKKSEKILISFCLIIMIITLIALAFSFFYKKNIAMFFIALLMIWFVIWNTYNCFISNNG